MTTLNAANRDRAEIAASQRISKNAYWSRLRRAFEYAAWFERNAA